MSQEQIVKLLDRFPEGLTYGEICKKLNKLSKHTIRDKLKRMKKHNELEIIILEEKCQNRYGKLIKYKNNKDFHEIEVKEQGRATLQAVIIASLILIGLFLQGCGSIPPVNIGDYCNSQCNGHYNSYIKEGRVVCICTEATENIPKSSVIINCSLPYMSVRLK